MLFIVNKQIKSWKDSLYLHVKRNQYILIGIGGAGRSQPSVCMSDMVRDPHISLAITRFAPHLLFFSTRGWHGNCRLSSIVGLMHGGGFSFRSFYLQTLPYLPLWVSHVFTIELQSSMQIKVRLMTGFSFQREKVTFFDNQRLENCCIHNCKRAFTL